MNKIKHKLLELRNDLLFSSLARDCSKELKIIDQLLDENEYLIIPTAKLKSCIDYRYEEDFLFPKEREVRVIKLTAKTSVAIIKFEKEDEEFIEIVDKELYKSLIDYLQEEVVS